MLKSALEKIVYFEARAQQLHGELASARDELSHLKEDLAAGHQRELDLRREVASLEVKSARAQAAHEELSRLNQALRLERDQLMAKLLDASRIHSSGQSRAMAEDDADELGFDLASFISQLRSEVILRGDVPAVRAPFNGPAVPLKASDPSVPWTERPSPAIPPRAPVAAVDSGLSPVAREAQRLQSEGRLRVSPEQMAELSGHSGSTTDETLFGFSVRELSAADAAARVRAAERLKALAHPAAAPALAAALHAETDATAQVALVQAFAGLCREEGASVVSPLLSSPVPEVRIAALKALLVLAPKDAAPHLAQAMKDSDRSVRRRASLLALGLEGETARRLGEDAIHDTDPEVRALAALALGAGRGENARTLLLGALDDGEARVRKAAAQSLSRILGHDVSAVVALDDAHRRREIRRLATLPVKPVRATLDAKPVSVSVAPVVAEVAQPVAVQAAQPVAANVAPQVSAQPLPSIPEHTAVPVSLADIAANTSQWTATPVAAPALAVATVGAARSAPAVMHGAAPAPARVANGGPVSFASGPAAPPSRPVASVPPAPVPPHAAPVPPHAAPVPPHAAPVSQAAPAQPAVRRTPVQAALVAMGAPPPARAPAPSAQPPVPPKRGPSPVEALCGAMLQEVRVAVRGRSLAELTSGLSAPAELAQEAVALLVARGAIVRRGHKYFAA
nr:HEAT repeat domain-containing protein [Corallococcus sp. NCSPR001]